jgi:hypothetical protein
MGLHETKKLLHSKGNGHQIKEAECEKIFTISQGIDNQNIQGAQKTKLPQKSMTQ